MLPLLTPRATSNDLARELIQQYELRQLKNTHQIFIMPEAIKTFHPEHIAETLFGSLVCNPPSSHGQPHCVKSGCCGQARACRRSFMVTGSQVAHRNATTQWLADYCGLPPDFESRISIKPYYSSMLIDCGIYLSADRILAGSYLFVHAPIERTWWHLNLHETIENPGTQGYPAGYFDTTATARAQLVDSFTSFIQHNATPHLEQVTFTPLKEAKMSCHAQDTTGCSDVQIIAGWNPLDIHGYLCGGALRLSVPTGHAPTASHLFEPIIGNTHHWKAGIQLFGHMLVWHNPHNNESCTLEGSIIINHLFATDQRRTFDVKDKPLSRYMLAQKVDTDNVDNLQGFLDGSFSKPAYVFANQLEPVANISTACVRSRVSVECELSFMFTFNRDNWNWHIGYDFWVDSREHLSIRSSRLTTQHWALKGDAQIFGFLAAPDGSLPQNTPIALSATQSNATIESGTNATATSSQLPIQNPGIDSPAGASAGSSNTRILYAPNSADTPDNQINTSIDPILLSIEDLDIEGARIAHKASKLFMHFQYTLQNQSYFSPSLGLGAEVDFGSQGNRKSCFQADYTTSFWGVWVHLGGLIG